MNLSKSLSFLGGLIIALSANATMSFSAQLSEVIPLGDLPGGVFESRIIFHSGSSTVVAGRSRSANGVEAFRWTEEEGMVGLGDLPGGGFGSAATAITPDGSTIVGTSRSTDGQETFRWTEAEGMVGLGDLPGGAFNSTAYGITPDGSTIVGLGRSANGVEAFRWTQAEGMVGLGDLPGGAFQSLAFEITPDGSTIVGSGTSANGTEAFRWTQAEGMVGLGDLPGGGFGGQALAITSDGSTIVGVGTSANGTEAFRWTQAEGMVGLGDLPDGGFGSAAYDITPDGSMIVGNGTTVDGLEGFVWQESTGMVSFSDWLAESGVTETGYTNPQLRAVSDDGTTVYGYGTSVNGEEAFIAVAGDGVLTESSATNSVVVQSDVSTMSNIALSLPLNGAHHQPLMLSNVETDNRCGWVSIDGAYYGRDQDAFIGISEGGLCYRLPEDNVMFGLGFGGSYSENETVNSGETQIRGTYAIGELNYIAPNLPDMILSATGLYGLSDAHIKRGYINSGNVETSTGETDIEQYSLRVRAHWLDAYTIPGADVKLTPRIGYTYSRTEIDGYTETTGSFPAQFDKRVDQSREARFAVEGRKSYNFIADSSVETVFRGHVELIHRFDATYNGTKGSIPGVFTFDVPGGRVDRNWLRVGGEVDHILDPSMKMNASLFASSPGEDPDISGAVSLSFEF